MKVNWSGIAHITAKVFSVILSSVIDVEKLAPLLGGSKGDVKQRAALEIALACLRSLEDLAAHAAATDPGVQTAIKQTIDAVVALMNAIEQAHLAEQRSRAAGVI